MQQEQPQFYATLTSHLSAEDQLSLQNVMAAAESVAQSQAAQMALAQHEAAAAAAAAAAAVSDTGSVTPLPSGMNGGTS